MTHILTADDTLDTFKRIGGGKAKNLALLSQSKQPVPRWICISTLFYQQFITDHQLQNLLHIDPSHGLGIQSQRIEEAITHQEFSKEMKESLAKALIPFGESPLAIRSSGLDEDSPDHSFAGQFSSFLYQKEVNAVESSIKKCWASAYSERCLYYRIHNGLPTDNLMVGVVIQEMIDSTCSGVTFTRNPTNTQDRDNLIISSVWGIGEGIVSGDLDADTYHVNRTTLKLTHQQIAEKTEQVIQNKKGGTVSQPVDKQWINQPTLNVQQVRKIAELSLQIEKLAASPQDIEWGIVNENIYILQTRPITTLPTNAFYNETVNGSHLTLWDNSNIIESYSGVTLPLTFSFASFAYRHVYRQFCEVIGVEKSTTDAYEKDVFPNMLGHIRGRVYYNLINWYKLVMLLPGSSKNNALMDTMMGVKQSLNNTAAPLFKQLEDVPKPTLTAKLRLYLSTLKRFITIDSIIKSFNTKFETQYKDSMECDFSTLNLQELVSHFHNLEDKVLKEWKAPIINDTLCMIFFGVLKKLTERWIDCEDSESLQNDLLCGQGGLDSTEPTKMLMRIAEKIDNGDSMFREWFITTPAQKLWHTLKPCETKTLIQSFLDLYGFRCINELKLEETDLHDDPSFALSSIQNYIKSKSYRIEEMTEREQKIQQEAERVIDQQLSGWKKRMYRWILKHARKAIRNRENLRFARTKIFGVVRKLFKAIGHHLTDLQILDGPSSIFYLTIDEVFTFIEGRSSTLNLRDLVSLRKKEFETYKDSPPPPDRFVTRGCPGSSFQHIQILQEETLTPTPSPSNNPNTLKGTPCSPGTVEGTVRVVSSIQDAEGLNGEILVTERTDPGWVPLYPSCSGLLIERGSLLSHSAVVARELGIPTIVSVEGGLITKLKTGQKVRVDASRGEITLL